MCPTGMQKDPILGAHQHQTPHHVFQHCITPIPNGLKLCLVTLHHTTILETITPSRSLTASFRGGGHATGQVPRIVDRIQDKDGRFQKLESGGRRDALVMIFFRQGIDALRIDTLRRVLQHKDTFQFLFVHGDAFYRVVEPKEARLRKCLDLCLGKETSDRICM